MHVVRHALALMILCASAYAGPRQCVSKHFALRVEGDKVVLADGRSFPFDDGKQKTFDQTLESPDVEDMFALPYKTGPIVAVNTENDDPGRVRIDALFEATWPKKSLTKGSFFGQPVRLQPRVLEALARVEKRVTGDKDLAPFFAKLGGTYNDRNIAGTDRRSAHAHGIAIDIDTTRSHYWRWQKGGWKNAIPQKIVDAFEAEGFIWGGRWFHFDTMHFEFRPELLDPECRPTS
jgi:hypothetical protein